jgi:ribosomal protein S18 acetylase RimI-like enzyme
MKGPLTSAPFHGEPDLPAMIDLLAGSRAPDRQDEHPSASSLYEMLSVPAQREGVRLWRDAEARLAGYALVDVRYCNVYWEIHPEATGLGLERDIIAWASQYLPQGRRAWGLSTDNLTLDASCRSDDSDRIALLELHGFQALPERSLHLIRRLADPIPAPTLPLGFVIRSVTGEQEVGALVALHRAAFGTENLSSDDRLSWMRTSDYDSNLDLVAVAPDGRLAAYCFCGISQEDNARTGRNEGFTDPVATHPDFQKLGLATALLLHGMRLLRDQGVDWAVLSTLNDNIAMQRTAQAVGFQVAWESQWFSRPLAGA